MNFSLRHPGICHRGTVVNPTVNPIKEHGMPVVVTDSNFESEVLQCDLPVLVDFWAPWCGPCRAIAPVVEELAKEYAGQVKVAKMNVDENPNSPSKFGIRAIPTLILFKGGEVVDQVTGAVSKASIKELISEKAL